MPEYITLAIPLFFALIAIEAIYSAVARKGLYRLDDSISSLSCGVTQQLVEVLGKLVLASGYVLLYEHARFLTLPSSWPVWVFTFLAVDFLYYWFHRASHTVSVLWGAHLPHHHSEEFNLTTALRQGAVESWCSALFYLPLALLGVSPLLFLTAWQLMTIYQFFVHTRAVGKLGPLEQALVTPSHHRVHHGKNPCYIDKNFGAILIVWDRLFGTLAIEREPVVYGTVEPLRSFNPLWAQVHHWLHLGALSRHARSWRDVARLWLGRPGWNPATPDAPIVIPEVSHDEATMYRPQVPRGLKAYALLQFVPTTAATTLFLEHTGDLSAPMVLGFVAFVLVSLAGISGTLEGRRWALPFELSRMAGLLGVLGLWPGLDTLLRLLGMGAVVGLAVLLWTQARAFRPTPATPLGDPAAL